jgi:hypothetical protein
VKDRKVKQVLLWGEYQWKRRGHKERMKENYNGGSILYSYMKIKQ